MSANIKASTDGTQAIIGVGGVDQMTVSNAGVVTANSFVGAISGNASSATALATGSTTARTLANRFADVVNVKDFGAVGNGVANDTAAIQAAFTYASANNKAIVDYTGNTYLYNTIINVGAIEIRGNFTLKATSGAYLNITGSLTEIGSIASNATKNDDSIQLSTASGISNNDVIIIWNSTTSSFSPHRPDYYDGEFAIVESTVANTINLKNSLLSNYSASSTNKVFKSSAITVTIDGPSFIGDGVFSVRIQYAKDVVIKQCRMENTNAISGVNALILNKCYNALIDGGIYRQKYTGPTGTGMDYGISISNCQYVKVIGVDSYGGRHAITTGGDNDSGAVPCRFVEIQDSILTNDPIANIYNADFHGNTIDSYYKNCVIYGAIGIGGENVGCMDCEVFTWPNSIYGPLRMQEVVGSQILFKDNKVHVGDGSTAFWVVGNVSSSLVNNISKPYQIVVDGLIATINSSVTTILNAYESSGQPNAWVLNNFGPIGNTTGLSNLINYTKLGAGIDASYIKIENPLFDATQYQLFSKNTSLPNTLIYWPYLVGDAPPIANVWYRGAVIYDRTPSASGFIGWVCVTDGAPGTWKTFGAISA